ncbi:MAG: hypothetical protein AB7U23_12455 [Dehalococcoidia bacterium]
MDEWPLIVDDSLIAYRCKTCGQEIPGSMDDLVVHQWSHGADMEAGRVQDHD